ncbi:hypothetical protein ACHAQF_001595 [Verticillium nonalfalfae]
MNIGTVTARWQEKAAENDPGPRAGRLLRTNVCLLEYCRDQKPPQCTLYKTRDSLKAGLAGLKPDQNLTLRLFVVEDLSQTVIEALGYKFGVEPDFFREHLYAYAWNNPRDPWKDAATLEVDLEQRRWFQIRFPRARYFQKDTTYSKDARGEEIKFNVERRADDDENRGYGRMRKLHAWRRFIPVFREMLSDMLLRVFHSSSHIETMRGSDFDTRAWLAYQTNNDGRVHDLITDVVLQPYKRDFALALGAMEEFQKRLERLTQLAVQTSIVDDSRRSMADNRNLHRLTWLATLFLPLSFIAALLSMQSKVSELGHTLWVWAVVAAPSAGLTLGVVLLISSITVKKAMSDFPWFGNWKPFEKKDSSRKR